MQREGKVKQLQDELEVTDQQIAALNPLLHLDTLRQRCEQGEGNVLMSQFILLSFPRDWYFKVTGYCEGAWFKNFAKVFSPCNSYAGVATTSNVVSFRSLRNNSVLQELVRSYHTLVQRYSRYTVQIFATSFLKLCASVRPVFLVYSPHKYCRGTDESFFE